MTISKLLLDMIACPKDGSELRVDKNYLVSKHRSYPIIDGVPILIDEEKSLFKIKQFVKKQETTIDDKRQKLKNFAKRILPSISKNLKAKENYFDFKNLLLEKNSKSRVLVIGGGIAGAHIDILRDSTLDIVDTDISFGPNIKVIADAHCLPFKRKSFDGVIVQAVLEHVIDPIKCVEEITRVLKNDGYVYAETPFMQQVHMPPYDFTRFTYLGHRNLFKQFAVIKSGAAIGPGSALAWSYLYFLLSFSSNKFAKLFLAGFAFLTSFWIKYFDYYLINRVDSLDAASAYYFIFKKLMVPVDKDNIINDYKGGKL